MASIINSDDGVVSGSMGLKQSADTSGNLVLQSNGNTVITIDTSLRANFAGIISATGNILSAGIISATGNILSAGIISSTGNVTSNNITITTSLAVGATTPSGTAGEIRATNAITAYYSDRRLKQDIVPIDQALSKVIQITGVTYTQNKLAEQFGYNDYQSQVGVIAQDVQAVLPQAVKLAPFDTDKNGNSISGENYLTVQYEKLVPLLVQAIKELNQEVELLKEKLKNAGNIN